MAKYVKTEQGYQEIETTVTPVVNQLNDTIIVPMIGAKMDKNNPVGTGSFSMGRKPGSVIGASSHAEGLSTTASGSYSHAEGSGTTASGSYSHAEGHMTTASGSYSHAEGSHTAVPGSSSHAEGSNTYASGISSHAEGAQTIARGSYSHAEGFSTTASSENQHVQGKYNVEDSQGKYTNIVGNGTSASARSNAHTLDWNGNAWYAGDVYTGSTSGVNKDEGSKKLATEEYVDSKQVQFDWNQNDETAADYVKNRTHYEEVVLGAPTTYSSLFYTGRNTWGDGAVAKALVYAFDSVNLGFTNSAVLQSNTRTGNTRTLVYAIGSGTLAIVAMADEGKVVVTNNTGASQKCSWEYPSTVEVVVHPLDEKYIPDSIARAAGDYIPIPSSAEVGQTIMVKAVDNTGKPTAWEAVDMPSGGGTAEEYELIFTDTVTEDTGGYFRDTDANGNTFALKKVILIVFTPPYEESDTSYGRGVGFLPTASWGHDCIGNLHDSIKSSAGGTGNYDVIFAEIIMGYQMCTARFQSQNTTNVFSVMQPVTGAGATGLQFVGDATKLMQFSNPTGNMTCVKIVGYANPIVAKNTQIKLYGVRA